ncbi:hypothetical protein PGT21_011265 [Puccinia graminis f. sp. tritici]|uniref:Uncharacterized protein n=1 Tax=Puccinia graminis f. sp. tritici TaxID=56615 RepID=A0A5B0S0F5_PUCGR|nr:hypothetical protein PGT21_011265 [Puccinia graminis f. sp. tritici]KAA1131520.1 hypothetical protein PGTUg99_024170 [Puccinia graminis f. sp. tritici]
MLPKSLALVFCSIWATVHGAHLPLETGVESSTSSARSRDIGVKFSEDLIIQEHERLPENHAQVGSGSDSDGAFKEAESANSSPITHHQLANLGFDQLVRRFPLLKAFTPQQTVQIRKTWKENHENLRSFSEQINRLQETFDYFQHVQPRDYNNVNTKVNSFKEKIKVHRLNKNVLELARLKVLELGTFSETHSSFKYINNPKPSKTKTNRKFSKLLKQLPPELFPSIRAQKFQNYVQSILNEIKEIICNHQPYHDPITGDLEEQSVAMFGYLFKTIELLFKNNFIFENDIKVLFQEDKVLKLCSIYFFHSSQEGISSEARECAPSFVTDQAFWKFIFTFFEVLDKQDKLRIEFELLVENMFLKANELASFREWDLFLRSFGTNKYLNRLKAVDKSDILKSLVEEKEAISPTSAGKEDFAEDVENLVHLFLGILNGPKKTRELSRYVCEILDFIDSNISPGILNKSFIKLRSPKYLKLQFDLILIPSRMKYFMHMALEFQYAWERRQSAFDLHFVESVIIDYQDKVISLHTELVKIYSKIENGYYFALSNWLKYNPQYSKPNEKEFNQWLQDMSDTVEYCINWKHK